MRSGRWLPVPRLSAPLSPSSAAQPTGTPGCSGCAPALASACDPCPPLICKANSEEGEGEGRVGTLHGPLGLLHAGQHASTPTRQPPPCGPGARQLRPPHSCSPGSAGGGLGGVPDQPGVCSPASAWPLTPDRAQLPLTLKPRTSGAVGGRSGPPGHKLLNVPGTPPQ